MKILYVVHSFPPWHWRGTEVYAMELARAMGAEGEARVFHLRPDPAAAGVMLEDDEFRGVKVHRARMKIEPSEPETYFFNPPQERAFRELLDQTRPDVVHFLYFTGGLSLSLPAAAREFGAKIVITVTDFSGACPRGQLLDRALQPCPGPRGGLRCLGCLFDKTIVPGHSRLSGLVRDYLPPGLVADRGRPELALLRRRLRAGAANLARADLVLYPNENTRERLHQAGLRGPRERLMDYGIDLSPFREHRKSEASRPRIGFIGQLLPHKGLLVAAEAVYSLPEAGNLICYGSLDDPGSAEYVRSLGNYRDRVDFRGTFAFDQMNRVLEGIDILVVPSQWQENCPLIVKYALATGTWALLADQPGIVAGREGLERARFFDPGDYLALRRLLIEVMKEVDKERGAGSAPARKAALDIGDQARELMAIYTDLYSEGPAEGMK